MSIIVRFSPIALTAKTYDETIRQIKNAGEWPPAGLGIQFANPPDIFETHNIVKG